MVERRLVVRVDSILERIAEVCVQIEEDVRQQAQLPLKSVNLRDGGILSNVLRRLGSPGPSTFAGLHASRQVSRARAQGLAVAAHEVAKIDVIESVTEAALLATARLGHLEAVLTTHTPHVQGRLQFIAEASAIGMGTVVQQAARKVL